jgi:hypothetical protein
MNRSERNVALLLTNSLDAMLINCRAAVEVGAFGLVGVCGVMIVTPGLRLSLDIEEEPATVLMQSKSTLGNRWSVVYW